MDNQGKKDSRLILSGIVGVILLVIIGVLAGILIGSRASRPAAQAAASTTVSAAPKETIEPRYLWHGMDIRKSGTGVYPGMSKERACQQVATEAAYWLINGTEPDRTKQIFQRFFLRTVEEAKGSTAHWIDHAEPPYVAKRFDSSSLINQEGPTTAWCAVAIDGGQHRLDGQTVSSQQPEKGTLIMQLSRKDKTSAWSVISLWYNYDNYESDIKQQGND